MEDICIGRLKTLLNYIYSCFLDFHSNSTSILTVYFLMYDILPKMYNMFFLEKGTKYKKLNIQNNELTIIHPLLYTYIGDNELWNIFQIVKIPHIYCVYVPQY